MTFNTIGLFAAFQLWTKVFQAKNVKKKIIYSTRIENVRCYFYNTKNLPLKSLAIVNQKVNYARLENRQISLADIKYNCDHSLGQIHFTYLHQK